MRYVCECKVTLSVSASSEDDAEEILENDFAEDLYRGFDGEIRVTDVESRCIGEDEND